jgi:hypothetical protein
LSQEKSGNRAFADDNDRPFEMADRSSQTLKPIQTTARPKFANP